MTLDPSMFSQAAADYQLGIDALIQNLGKNILVVFANTVTNVQDTFYDQVRDNEELKPSFKQTNSQPAPNIFVNETVILALVKWDPQELNNFEGQRIDGDAGYVRLKTTIDKMPALQRCDYIMVQSDRTPYAEIKCKRYKKAVTFGMQQNQYCLSYWQVVT